MTTAVRDDLDSQTYLPADGGAAVVDFVEHLHAHVKESARPRLVAADGTSVDIPETMFAALVKVADAMRAGLAVTVAPHHLTMSTQEAADLLRISRTTLVRLLENGEIPFDKPSRHRKVRLADLLEYRERQRRRADDALADMVADSQRLGLYEKDPDAVRAAVKAARAASITTR
jgi:excisionase family DNA binding protein